MFSCSLQLQHGSASSSRLDRMSKKRVYARNGVGHLWLVDPMAQTLEVLRLTGEFWQEIAVYGGNERVRAQPFDAVESDLAAWWDA
ncbi:MAG: Uma2 family endonuclease [Candidatus Riflebacteria bacterium]|nr:Uma2 family endonuclease [Candidatus Riflebacteria bacterium]